MLTYLNQPDSEKLKATERSDLEKRLRGPGLTAEPNWAGAGAPGGQPRGDDRHVRPHWRRGHFRLGRI
jgi:hypothetical protein